MIDLIALVSNDYYSSHLHRFCRQMCIHHKHTRSCSSLMLLSITKCHQIPTLHPPNMPRRSNRLRQLPCSPIPLNDNVGTSVGVADTHPNRKRLRHVNTFSNTRNSPPKKPRLSLPMEDSDHVHHNNLNLHLFADSNSCSSPQSPSRITDLQPFAQSNPSLSPSSVILPTSRSAPAGMPALNSDQPTSDTSSTKDVNVNTGDINTCAIDVHPPIGRQHQYNQLCELITPVLECKSAVSLYISGTPGTGKTFTISTICKHLSSPHLWVNCATLSNPKNLYILIAKELSLPQHTQDAIRVFAASPGPPIVLVLDEIDFLTSRDQTVLYSAFEWPSIPNSRLSVVGIANSIDLPIRILPWLRQAGCMPHTILFTPYTSTDLQAIAEQKLQPSESHLDTLAISLAAKKVAAGSGDARLMLDVCDEADMIMSKQGHRNTTGITVVSSVISRRGGLSAAVDTIKKLPVQQQLALCVAANATTCSSASTARVNKKATLGGLYDSFVRMCQRAHVSCLSFSEFADICCNSLVHHGLVDVPLTSGRGKAPRTLRGRPIRIRVPLEDVQAGVADKGFLPLLVRDCSS